MRRTELHLYTSGEIGFINLYDWNFCKLRKRGTTITEGFSRSAKQTKLKKLDQLLPSATELAVVSRPRLLVLFV
jgi:hypothetical protein